MGKLIEENQQLKKHLARLEQEKAILKIQQPTLPRDRVRYGFIKEQTKHFSIGLLCRVLGVSSRGYYDWLSRKPSQQEQANKVLDKKIKVVYMKHKQQYGSPQITLA